MGFLGGDNEPSRGEELADQQLRQNQAELESKKQNLYQTRLDIIKGQGKEVWTPDMNRRAPTKNIPGFKFGNVSFGGKNF
jgi:hypothetical protein